MDGGGRHKRNTSLEWNDEDELVKRITTIEARLY